MAMSFYQIEKNRPWYLLKSKEDAATFFTPLLQTEIKKIYINIQSFSGEYEFWQNQLGLWECRQMMICFTSGTLCIQRDLAGRLFACMEEAASDPEVWDGRVVENDRIYLGEAVVLNELFSGLKPVQILPVAREEAENSWLSSGERDEAGKITGLRLTFSADRFLEIRLAASSLEFYFFGGEELTEEMLSARYSRILSEQRCRIASLSSAEQLLVPEEYSIEDVQSIFQQWDRPPFKLSDWQWEEAVALLQEFSLAGQKMLSLEPAEQGLLAVKVYQEIIGYLPQQGNRRAKYHLAQGKSWIKYLEDAAEQEKLEYFLAKNNGNTEEDELREILTGREYLELICKAALRRTKARQAMQKQKGKK